MTKKINGLLVDNESRCQHYHSPLDIVALKCYDCQKYYACYQCHDHIEDHRFRAYPCHIRQDKVVICGVCLHEMTIENYQKSISCSHCHSRFNPACSKQTGLVTKETMSPFNRSGMIKGVKPTATAVDQPIFPRK